MSPKPLSAEKRAAWGKDFRELQKLDKVAKLEFRARKRLWWAKGQRATERMFSGLASVSR